RRRAVRLAPGLQVLYLRDVVDPAGDHPCDRRSLALHLSAGAYPRPPARARRARAQRGRAPLRTGERPTALAARDREGTRAVGRAGASDRTGGASQAARLQPDLCRHRDVTVGEASPEGRSTDRPSASWDEMSEVELQAGSARLPGFLRVPAGPLGVVA